MNIVNVSPIVLSSKAEVIRFTVGHAAPNSTSGKPHRKAMVIVISSIAVL